MMKDNFMVLPIMGLTIAGIILCVAAGDKLAEMRIYQKCLDKNGTLVHNDAVKHCKEIIK
jgi:hypothetical protein